MSLGRLSGKSITWTPPTWGRISTLLGQKGGGPSGAGPFLGRVRDQNPSEGRRSGQAGGIRTDPGSTARGQRVRRVDDPRRGETLRAWPSPYHAPAGLRRQRVQPPQDSGLSQTAGDSLHHPTENQRTTHRSFQPGPVPATQFGGADNQPTEAIPSNGHPVREEGRKLSGNAANRVVTTLVIVCKHPLVLQRRFLNLVSFWAETASRRARPQSCQACGQVAMKRCSRSLSCEPSL